MKEITKNEMKKLVNLNIIHNTSNGYMSNKNGYYVGYYRSKNKRYIEDEYADIAQNLKG